MAHKLWQRIFSVLLMAGMLFGFIQPMSAAAGFDAPLADYSESALQVENALDKVEGLVLEQIQIDGAADFFVWMTEKADLSPAYDLETKEEKGQFVFEALRSTAERTQKELLTYLESQGADYKAFYIANKVLVYGGSLSLVESLANRMDVGEITANHQFQLQEPFIDENAPDSPTVIEPNLTFINADDVWALGITGSGTVMAGNDTGLDWDHPALINKYRGWDGSTADHNYNWWDATGTYPTVPNDGHGHGTHTTGTMVGDDGGDNQIGVAPGAQMVHCKNMTDGGSGSDATFTECFQWDLAPWDLSGANPDPSLAPDAINNSWGYWGGGQNQFRDEVQALHAAGILVEVSAGNEGSSCSSLRSPGDYFEVLTTGSVNHVSTYPGTITGFSSRGPSSLDPGYYFPDIMAPGENIRSSVPGGSYQGGWSGTSMSGPHATALVGLMWDANPALQGNVEQTLQMIVDTAVPLTGQNGSNCGGDYTEGPNNDWGFGTIDALAAVQAAFNFGGTGTLEGNVTDSSTTNPLQYAQIEATLSPTQTWTAETDILGDYSMVILSGTYTVTASLFGYIPETVTGVTVISGSVTTQDFALDQAPSALVYGYVTDVNTGWPLYASIDIVGYPGGAIWTDPVTGYYEVTLPEGSAYDFHVESFVEGYVPQDVTVGPISGDTQQDFPLDVDAVACNAPGYSLSYAYLEDFEANDGGYTHTGTPTDYWQWGTPVTWPSACASGSQCWGTNLNGSYENNANYELESPVLDLTSESAPLTARWWQAWDIESSSWDHAYAEVSINDGAYDVMWEHTGGTITVDWTEMTADISAAAGGTAQFRFRFTSDGSVTYDGYYIDRVAVTGAGGCTPADGGLVVGNVYEDNFNMPLTGAMVTNESGGMTYAVETLDPGVDDAFYTLFSPAGSQVFTATMTDYNDDVQTVNVVAGDTVGQDFYLSSGALVADPTSLSIDLVFGSSDVLPLTLSNVGTGDASFEISEKDRGWMPSLTGAASPDISVRERLEGFDANATSTDGILSAAGTEVLGLLEAGDVLDQWPSGLALPWGTGFSFDDLTVWLSNPGAGGGDDLDHEFEVDGTPTGRTLNAMFGGSWGGDLAFNPNTGMLWQVNVGGDNCLYELDPASGQTGNSVCGPWGISQRGVAYDLVGDTFFVGGWNDLTIYHIDSSGGLIQQWNLGLSISGLAYNYEAGLLFIIENSPTDTVSVFDVAAGSIIDTFSIAGFGNYAGAGLEIDCDGNLWAANQVDFNAYLVDSGVPASLCSSDVPWLTEDPISGTVPAGLDQVIDVTFDASGSEVQPGEYYADLQVDTDTPYGRLTVPVTMTVLPSADLGLLEGTVVGLGYCDGEPMLLEEAEVTVESGTGMVWNLLTNELGEYSYYIDEAQSPLTVTVTYPGHEMGQETGVVIVGGGTTTVDFGIRWLQPCIGVTPTSMEVSIDMGLSTVVPLTLTNTGAAELVFEFQEVDGGFIPAQQLVQIPRFEGELPESSEPASTGKPPTAPSPDASGELPGIQIPFGAAAYALDVYPGLSLVYFPDADVPGTWDVVASVPQFHPAADFLNGDFSTLYALDYDTNQFVMIDTATGARTVIGTATPSGSWTGMSGASDGTLYAMSSACGTNSTLYTIDPDTGALTMIGDVGAGTCIIDIAINANGEMYGVDIVSDNLYQIDPSTGAGTVIGSTGVSANYAQGMDFEEESGILYWAAYTASGEMRIIDTDTGASVLVGAFPGGNEVDGLAFATGGGGDIPWLFEDPITGTLPADTGQLVADITFDASVPEILQPGEYYGTLNVDSSDPVNDKVSIPVTMTVLASPDLGKLEGTVTGLGYCDADPAPLNEAEVNITGSGGGMWTLTTDEAGYYSMWINAPLQSPVSVSVSYPDHESGMEPDVQISAGMTTTVNFDLRWMQPCVSVDPMSFEVSVGEGFSLTNVLELINAGAAGTDFSTLELNGSVVTLGGFAQQSPLASSVTGGGIQSLSGSFVEFDSSVGGDDAFIPGTEQTFCFRSESFTNDWEYVLSVWEQFPTDWTVNDVYVQGTPACDYGGTWGSFSWSYQDSNPYEIRIDHSRFQANPTDHCVAYYCFDVVSGESAVDAPVSWFYDGDGWGSPPHNPCSDDGYTPSGQSACDESVNPQAFVPIGAVDMPWLWVDPVSGTIGSDSNFFVDLIFDASATPLGDYTGTLKVLSDDPMYPTVDVPLTLHVVTPAFGVDLGGDYAMSGVPGEIVMYTLVLTNASNGPSDSFDISLGTSNFTATASTAVVGPLAGGASATFDVYVEIPPMAQVGESDAVEVMVTSQGDNTKTDTAMLTTSVTGEFGVMMTTDQTEGSGAPGGVAVYTVMVTNTGALPDTIYLLYWDVDPGWEVEMMEDSFDLAAGESAQTTFYVHIPVGAATGDWDAFMLQAKSWHDPSKWNEMEFMTTVTVPQIYLPFINKH